VLRPFEEHQVALGLALWLRPSSAGILADMRSKLHRRPRAAVGWRGLPCPLWSQGRGVHLPRLPGNGRGRLCREKSGNGRRALGASVDRELARFVGAVKCHWDWDWTWG
jgi:hypothetical protein